jgi:hypothetical protein
MEVIKTLGSVYFGNHRPWYEADDPFVENFTTSQPRLIKHHDKNNKPLAEYQLDQHGFRNSADMNAGLWFLGCSDTFGESLPQQQIFPQLIADALGCEYYNFGTPGAGIELVARLLFKLRHQLSGKKVIVLLPSLLRYETIVRDLYKCMVPANTEYLAHLPVTGNPEKHIQHKVLFATMLLKSLVEKHDCSFFHFHPYENAMEEAFRNQLGSRAIPVSLLLDRAADGKHYGPLTHQAVAEFMLEFLRQ